MKLSVLKNMIHMLIPSLQGFENIIEIEKDTFIKKSNPEDRISAIQPYRKTLQEKWERLDEIFQERLHKETSDFGREIYGHRQKI